VYMSIFDKGGDVRFDTSAQIITKDSFEAYNNKKIVLFGSEANKFKELFESDPAIAIDTTYRHSSAYLTCAAWQKYIDRDFEDMIYFEPFYLKEFVATTPKKQNLA